MSKTDKINPTYDTVIYWVITWSIYGDGYKGTDYNERLRHPYIARSGHIMHMN